jgi:hypothetical protein
MSEAEPTRWDHEVISETGPVRPAPQEQEDKR